MTSSRAKLIGLACVLVGDWGLYLEVPEQIRHNNGFFVSLLFTCIGAMIFGYGIAKGEK
jgi:hypothetical protein